MAAAGIEIGRHVRYRCSDNSLIASEPSASRASPQHFSILDGTAFPLWHRRNVGSAPVPVRLPPIQGSEPCENEANAAGRLVSGP